MATLTVQSVIGLSGVTPTYAAAASGGDKFPNDGKTLFHAKNGSGSPITVTVASLVTCNQGQTHNNAVVVGANSEEMIGPFDQSRFSDGTGLVSVTYSGVTSLTVAALKVQA